MPQYLSEQWIDLYASLGAQLPERVGLDIITQFIVEKTPNGNVRYFDVVRDGRVVEAALGKNKAADVTITWRYEFALKMLAGELGPSVAFMQGRIKVEGDYVRWLNEWVDVLNSNEYESFRIQLFADTQLFADA
ncbi:MAG: SCP2 sterol-binding domain-containing protein [Acidimicrobiales bacterium]